MKKAAALLLLLFAVTSAAQPVVSELQPSRLRWLVQFDTTIEATEANSIADDLGIELVDPGPYATHFVVDFQLPPDEKLIERIRGHEAIDIFEREARYGTSGFRVIPGENDPLREQQWALEMIRLEKAHLLNFGADPGVVVAILDTGIAYADNKYLHAAPDLEGTIIHPGFDFISMDEEPLDEGDGEIGHGTMMAGIIAQTTFNRRGSAGIAFNAALLPVRVVNKRGFARASDVARGIRYAVANGASVIVLGFSGPANSMVVDEAIAFADKREVPVIAPAGNGVVVGYPASNALTISVGAVDVTGQKAYYSPQEGSINILAPGGDARAGVDRNQDGLSDGVLVHSFLATVMTEPEYLYIDGTSVAAAHVAGVAALLLSHSTNLSNTELFNALCQSGSVDDIPLLDAFRSLKSLQKHIFSNGR